MTGCGTRKPPPSRKGGESQCLHYPFPAQRAAEMEMGAQLLSGLEHWLERSGMRKADAARFLGVTQARVSAMHAARSTAAWPYGYGLFYVVSKSLYNCRIARFHLEVVLCVAESMGDAGPLGRARFPGMARLDLVAHALDSAQPDRARVLGRKRGKIDRFSMDLLGSCGSETLGCDQSWIEINITTFGSRGARCQLGNGFRESH